MKRLKESFKMSFPPVKLYRGEIEAIYACMRAVSDKIGIEAEGYEFDDIDELFSFNKVKINRLRLFIVNPIYSIKFEPDRIRLESDNNTDVILGSAEKLKAF